MLAAFFGPERAGAGQAGSRDEGSIQDRSCCNGCCDFSYLSFLQIRNVAKMELVQGQTFNVLKRPCMQIKCLGILGTVIFKSISWKLKEFGNVDLVC